jgi:hypothetical protein
MCLMPSTRYSCQILIKPEFTRQNFEKNTQTSNLMKIIPVGHEFLKRTDMHDEAESLS